MISTAGDATLAVADPDPIATGKLVNGAFALPQPLQAKASSPAAGAGSALAPVGGSANPTSLLTWTGPVSNDPVTVAFKQAIGAGDATADGDVQQDADVHALHHEPVGSEAVRSDHPPAPAGGWSVRHQPSRREFAATLDYAGNQSCCRPFVTFSPWAASSAC